MTGTRRTPINRPPGPKITPAAVRLFDTMMRIRCSCDPDDRYTKCPGCKEWDHLDEMLMFEMKIPRVVYPTISNPAGKNPYPPFTHNYATWKPDLEAQERWLLLAEASRAAKRARRRVTAPVAAPEPESVD
jgi:hypothetical protein